MNNNKYIFSTYMGYVSYVVRVILRVSLLNLLQHPKADFVNYRFCFVVVWESQGPIMDIKLSSNLLKYPE